MRVIVGEGSEAVEFLLTRCVPEGELDVVGVDEDVCECGVRGAIGEGQVGVGERGGEGQCGNWRRSDVPWT